MVALPNGILAEPPNGAAMPLGATRSAEIASARLVVAAGSETPVYCSQGTNKYDAYPEQRAFNDFDAFEEFCLKEAGRSSEKGHRYVCAPFKEKDGRHHRCLADVLPCSWLPLDLDGGLDGEQFADVRMRAAQWRGFGYFTASSQPQAPRARLMFELDRAVNREERIRLGVVVAAALSDVATWDKSVYQSEQPVYLPLRRAESFRFEGEPLRVADWLKAAPEPRTEPSPVETAARSDDLFRALEKRKLLKSYVDGKLNIRCPFSRDAGISGGHDDDESSSTVYYPPHTNGLAKSTIHCLHQKCRDRKPEDFRRALGLVDDRYTLLDPEEAAVNLDAARRAEYPAVIVDRYLFKDAGVLIGAGGSSKSSIVLQEAICIALGLPVWGLEVKEPGRTLIISGEDDRDTVLKRLASIANAMGLSDNEQRRALASIYVDDSPHTRMARFVDMHRGDLFRTLLADVLLEKYEGRDLKQIIADTYSLLGAPESAMNEGAAEGLRISREVAKKLGCCWRWIGHTSISTARSGTTDQYTGRGAAALADNSRLVAQLVVQRDRKATDQTNGAEYVAPFEITDTELSEGNVVRLHRHKLSYMKSAHNEVIWIVRDEWKFTSYVAQARMSDEEKQLIQQAQSREETRSNVKGLLQWVRKENKEGREAGFYNTYKFKRSEWGSVGISELKAQGAIYDAEARELLIKEKSKAPGPGAKPDVLVITPKGADALLKGLL